MKSTKKAKLAALLTAGAMTLAVPAPALGQSQANQVAQINTGNLISALNNISAEINNLEALNDLSINNPLKRLIAEQVPERRGLRDDVVEAVLQGAARMTAVVVASALVRQLAKQWR